MKRIILVLLSVIAITATAEELSSADKKLVAEANQFFQRGNKFAQDKSLPRAKVEYQKALRIFPRHVDALYNLAVTCEKLGQNDEAVEHYRHYLEIQPNDADVWTQLGVRYDEGGKNAEAQAAYEKALAINPKFGLAHHNLGVLLKERGDLDGAQAHFETFVKLEEDAGRHNGDAYYSLGALNLGRGRVKEAKRLLQQALDVDPSVSYYNNAMGDVYLVEGGIEMAISAYKKALEKDAKYAPAYSGLGDAYRQKGDRMAAEKSYRQALELRKDYMLVHYKLGLLFETANPSAAIKEFENYLSSGKNGEFQTEAKAKIEKLKPVQTK